MDRGLIKRLTLTFAFILVILTTFSSNVRANDMYVYDKYKAVSNVGDYKVIRWEYLDKGSIWYSVEVAKSYEIDPNTGSFSLTGGMVEVDELAPMNKPGYYKSHDGTLQRWDSWGRIGEETGSRYPCNTYKAIIERDIYYTKGELVASNIKGTVGQYPNGWRHTDGYFYIRKGLANTKPTIEIDDANLSQTINSKGSIIITGKASDPDAGTLTVTATIAGRQKTITKTTPISNSSWQLVWSGEELTEGKYSSIPIIVNDGKETATAYHTGVKMADKTRPSMLLEAVE